jgi:altronate dehydratase small subunit
VKGEVIDAAALVMDGRDNVATALEDCEAGRAFEIDGERIVLTEAVPFGHTFALAPVDRGGELYKYGSVIGRATEAVAPGDWVHTHNCESTRGRGDVAAGRGGDRA